MSRFERCACGRWKCTDRQSERWFDWIWRGHKDFKYIECGDRSPKEPRLVKMRRTLGYRLRQPIWWRLSTRCMGWYDCISRDESPEQYRDYPWWVRLMFKLEPLKGGVSDANTEVAGA